MTPPPTRYGASFVVTAVSVVALSMVLLLSLVEVLVQTATASERWRKGGPVAVQAIRDLTAAQRAELAEESQWVDRRAGILSIPIENAMDLVLEELARDPAAATGGVNGPR